MGVRTREVSILDHDNNALYEITADHVTIEVTDLKTGKTVKRTLPVNYRENAHFLRLTGEDMTGKPSQIVFFSESGVDKLRDMTGGGPDIDPCGSHIN
ncbi:MAG: hypothetical protein EOM14_17425 [Clostridia bacterium]|nr:hypothetical protein [Clostridia bacterium]